MRAAGPLLQLLGRLRVALMRASFASLMEQVADAVRFSRPTSVPWPKTSDQQANTAKYILCATADDIVQHISTEERHVWTQYSMLSRFFGERVGGGGSSRYSTISSLIPRPTILCSSCSTPASRWAFKACIAPAPGAGDAADYPARTL